MCVLTSSRTFFSETFLILGRNELDMIKSSGLHVTYPLFLCDFSETSICSTDFR